MFDVVQGDALEVAQSLAGRAVAIVSDPPYGGNYNTKYGRFTGGKKASRNYKPVANDNKPFDPSPWLDYRWVTLWGYHHFATRLPVGTVLVWNKRREAEAGKYLSDCELAWQKGGIGVYIFHHLWRGFDRASERGAKLIHPTQKPVALMRWCIERLKLPAGTLVFDPYCGSGSTGVAAIELGYDFVGCDLDGEYVEGARQRCQAAADRVLSVAV